MGAFSSKRFEEYAREYAGDCIRLACEAKEPSARQKLIELASSWMSLARQEQTKQPDKADSPPRPRSLATIRIPQPRAEQFRQVGDIGRDGGSVHSVCAGG